MADRTIVVRLRGVDAGLTSSLTRARASARSLERELAEGSRKNERQFKQLGLASAGAGAAIGLALGGAVATAARFDKAMSGVGAVANASAKELQELRQAALDAGASTKLAGVSASDAARAEAELVKAGVQVSDVLGGALMGSLSLANAGQLDFGKSAEIAAQAMNIFGLSGRDVGHVADVLAAGANKSAADVTQLGDALRQGGLMAAQTGLGLEDTVGVLAAFSDRALIGSDAGTSLKTMLQRLTPSSNEAATEMERLGFSAFDAQGQFIGLEGLAGEMETAFGGLSTEQRNLAMNTIFGSDAIRGANVLMEVGAEGVREYTAAVDDQGAAQRMAAAQVDNLAGDVEALGGAFESALIESGSKANGVLREIVQGATNVVSGFSELPGELQGGILAFGGLTSAGLLAVGAAGTLIPKIREVRGALDKMGAAGQLASRLMLPVFGVGGAVIAGVAVAASVMGNATRKADEYVEALTQNVDTSSIDGLTAGVRSVETDLAAARQEWEWFGDSVSRTVRGVLEGVNPWMENTVADTGQSIDRLEQQVADYREAIGRMGANSGLVAYQLGISEDAVISLAEKVGVDLAGAYDDVAPALRDAHVQAQTGTPITNDLADANEELASEVATVEERFNAFEEALEGVLGMAFNMTAAEDEITAGLLDIAEDAEEARKSEEGFSTALEGNSRAAVDNRAKVMGLVEDIAELARVQVEQGRSTDEVSGTLATQKQRLEDTLTQLGFNREEVAKYTGALDLVPTGIETAVSTPGLDSAIADVEALKEKFGSVARAVASASAEMTLKVQGHSGTVMGRAPVGAYGDGYGFGFADGGRLPGHATFQPATGSRGLVQWAEPETQGEWFLPNAPGKRSRSLGIAQSMLAGWGYGLVPMADGGLLDVLASVAGDVQLAPDASGGYQQMFAALQAVFPWVSLISGSRPGAITATGKPSYHGMGRAVDINPSMALFDWISANYPNSRELIFSPAGHRQIHNGSSHWYGEPTRGDHWDHVHWAMKLGGFLNPHVRDDGGPLLPGFTYNGTGRPEMVVPMADGGLVGAGVGAVGHRGALGAAARNAISVSPVRENMSTDFDTLVREIDAVAEAYVDLSYAVDEATAQQLLAQNLLPHEYVDAARIIIDTAEDQRRAQEQAARAAQEASEDAARAAREAAEEAARAAEADYRRRVDINNNLFELGLLSTADHLSNLDRRMAREEQYSDEWMALYRQRQHVIDDELAAMAEQARKAEELFGSFADPVRELGDLVGTFGRQQSVGADEILAMLDHRVEAAERWKDTLETLRSSGLQSDLLTQLAQAGPEALGLAQGLLGADAATINARLAQLGQLGAGVGGMFTGGAGSTTVHVAAGAIVVKAAAGATDDDVLRQADAVASRIGVPQLYQEVRRGVRTW